VAAHQGAQILDAEPGDAHLHVDGTVAERFEEMGLACPARPGHDQILPAADPFERAQRALGWRRDGRTRLDPGVKGLARGEMRSSSAHFDGGAVPTLGLGDEERTQDVGGVPALGPGGEHHLFDLLAPVLEPEPPTQRDHLVDGDGRTITHDPAPSVVVL
jgi:hypothetical protein